MDLSVIIVSYNTRDLLRNSVRSLVAALRPADGTPGIEGEVFVVDNASPDDSAAMVRREFPDVHLLASETNLGFAKANNLAIERVAGRHVMFLNPDTLVHTGAPARLLGLLDSHPHAAIAGPRLEHGDGSFQHSAFRFPSLWQILLDFFVDNHRVQDSRLNGRYPRRLYAGDPFPVDHLLGACFMVRREAMDRVGPMDEDFYMYCEEIDWSIRFRRAGWEIYCVPAAVVTHFAAQSTQQLREKMYVELFRSRYRLFQKHYSRSFFASSRRIVQVGLWQEARGARRAYRRGEMDRSTLESRLTAYREVASL